MRNLLREMRLQRMGATMTLVVLFMPALLSIIGVMLDGGAYLLERQKLGAAVDAGAIQGAEMYEPTLLWQGEEKVPCSGYTSGQCLGQYKVTCWQLWTFNLDSIAAEKAAKELAQVNYDDPEAEYSVEVRKYQKSTSELRLPKAPGEEPAGVSQWRVMVRGSGKAHFYFLRIVGLEESNISVFSAVTWQKQDKYEAIPGVCPP